MSKKNRNPEVFCCIFQYSLTKIGFLCYLVHGELLCGGLVVRTPNLTTAGFSFLPLLSLMHCTATLRQKFFHLFAGCRGERGVPPLDSFSGMEYP